MGEIIKYPTQEHMTAYMELGRFLDSMPQLPPGKINESWRRHRQRSLRRNKDSIVSLIPASVRARSNLFVRSTNTLFRNEVSTVSQLLDCDLAELKVKGDGFGDKSYTLAKLMQNVAKANLHKGDIN